MQSYHVSIVAALTTVCANTAGLATGLAQRQARGWSAIPPKAEVAHNIGAVVETAFMLTLQSECPIATTNMMMEHQPITEPLCAAEWRYGA